MFVAAAVTFVHFAAAEPTLVPGVDLVWRAPPGCPDAAAVARMVGALVRRPPAIGRESPRVRAVVSRFASGRWELRLDLHARLSSALARTTISRLVPSWRRRKIGRQKLSENSRRRETASTGSARPCSR